MKTAPELLADVEDRKKTLADVLEAVVPDKFHRDAILAAAHSFVKASVARATAEECTPPLRSSMPITSVGLN